MVVFVENFGMSGHDRAHGIAALIYGHFVSTDIVYIFHGVFNRETPDGGCRERIEPGTGQRIPPASPASNRTVDSLTRSEYTRLQLFFVSLRRNVRIMIHIENLRKSYGSFEAVKGISLSIESGEIYSLLGPNGAGKSTTINIISGLLSPSSGSVSVGGFNVFTQPQQAKRILGVVPQESYVVEELSAFQNCMFFGSLYGLDREELKKRSMELLSWIGLADRLKEPVGQYSGGMKRRLSLVLGILHEPDNLVLDEPTVGLDPQTRLRILDAIAEIAGRGTAVLLSTHYLDESEKLSHRIGIIDEGLILIEGTLQRLRAEIEDVQTVTLRGTFNRRPVVDAVESIDGAEVLHDADDEMVLTFPSTSQRINEFLERVYASEHLREVTIKPPSLESLFIRLTGKEMRE
jgi:ABC-2 type transport system ATP-binding protein